MINKNIKRKLSTRPAAKLDRLRSKLNRRIEAITRELPKIKQEAYDAGCFYGYKSAICNFERIVRQIEISNRSLLQGAIKQTYDLLLENPPEKLRERECS